MLLPIVDHLFTFDTCTRWQDKNDDQWITFRQPILKQDIGTFRFNSQLDEAILNLTEGILVLIGLDKRFETKVRLEVGLP